jgi:2,5-diketo-D-gluconate reductase A
LTRQTRGLFIQTMRSTFISLVIAGCESVDGSALYWNTVEAARAAARRAAGDEAAALLAALLLQGLCGIMQPHGRIRRHRAPVKKMFIAMAVLPFICRSAAAAPAAPPPPSQQSTVTLSNGVVMPRILLGMGLWCNTERCPAPAKPCADCYNDGEAAADIALALANGFHGIDTALGYGNQRGVGAAVRSRPAGTVFVQTKIPGCGSRNASECAAQAEANIATDIRELGLEGPIDSVLIHGPPGPHGAACKEPASCAAAVAQWQVLERTYVAKKVRSIGVSNFCATCLECLTRGGATIVPHVNQIQYHAGMPGADPTGLISYNLQHKIVPQAYSPLGNYATHSLLRANITHAVGETYNRSAAQVALRWVIQNNSSLCVAANKASYLAEDSHIWDFQLSSADMQRLNTWAGAQEDPTRGTCV